MNLELLILLSFLSLAPFCSFDVPVPQSKDQLAIIGNTFVEHARWYGRIKTVLQIALVPKLEELRFLNLEWGGDWVLGDLSAYFCKSGRKVAQLDRKVSQMKSTVVCFATAR